MTLLWRDSFSRSDTPLGVGFEESNIKPYQNINPDLAFPNSSFYHISNNQLNNGQLDFGVGLQLDFGVPTYIFGYDVVHVHTAGNVNIIETGLLPQQDVGVVVQWEPGVSGFDWSVRYHGFFSAGFTPINLVSGDTLRFEVGPVNWKMYKNNAIALDLTGVFTPQNQPDLYKGTKLFFNSISALPINIFDNFVCIPFGENVITSFNTYGSIYNLYDINFNIIPIKFIKNTGQTIPLIRFVDSSPIPNFVNYPMVGDGNTLRFLADNGKQPGFGISHYLYKIDGYTPPRTINVDIRHSDVTLITIERHSRWPL